MSPHSDTLYWLRADQFLFLLFNAACLAEKQQIPFFSLWFDPTGIRTPISRMRGEHANHYTTDAVLVIDFRKTFFDRVLC